ncbi:MAG: NAD(P)-dependent oxidoreductase [bacterium]
MKKVVFTEVEEKWQQEYLQEKINPFDLQVEFVSGPLAEVSAELKEATEILSVFIRSECTEDELKNWPVLEYIATRSTGFDHIDLKYCREKGIDVSNVPTYGDNTVAEHTFALILSLSRKIYQTVQCTMHGDYRDCDQLQGFDLRGKKLGVIGVGNIGKHVIKMARGFGMEVLAFDIDRDIFIADLLGFEYVELKKLLEESHIITLHCPLNDSTRHLMDYEEFESCRDGALVINTSRGEIINTEALLAALQSGKISGAGLDVVEGEELVLEEPRLNEKDFPREKLEQLIQNNRLIKRDDVIFTPHMAYNSKEAVERILATTVANIRAFISGGSQNSVIESQQFGS